MGIFLNKKIFLTIAVLIILVSVGVIAIFGLKSGIDFTGGSLTEVHYSTLPEKSEVEAAIAPLNLGTVAVRASESEAGRGYLITTRSLTESERKTLESGLQAIGKDGNITQFTSIGPVIGQELKDKAVWAIGAVLVLIICYVAFAFSGIGKPVSSWIYGFTTIAVLGHDILLPVAFMSLYGHYTGAQVDVLFITALLTVLGFSVNDTIVIFDRIREKLQHNRTESRKNIPVPGGKDHVEITYKLTRPFGELVDEAINETMTRSINTSLTVLLALVALYFFGSSVTHTFVLTLMVGVVFGAYSSIFIASPLLVVYQEWLAKREAQSNNK